MQVPENVIDQVSRINNVSVMNMKTVTSENIADKLQPLMRRSETKQTAVIRERIGLPSLCRPAAADPEPRRFPLRGPCRCPYRLWYPCPCTGVVATGANVFFYTAASAGAIRASTVCGIGSCCCQARQSNVVPPNREQIQALWP